MGGAAPVPRQVRRAVHAALCHARCAVLLLCLLRSAVPAGSCCCHSCFLSPSPANQLAPLFLPQHCPRSVQDCAILNQCLSETARLYPATKFLKIVSTGGLAERGGRVGQAQQAGCRAAVLAPCGLEKQLLRPPSVRPTIALAECIPGYPDANLPTVLVYRDTKCLHTVTGLRHFGGRETSPELVSAMRRLGRLGALGMRQLTAARPNRRPANRRPLDRPSLTQVAISLNRYGDICGDAEDQERQVRGAQQVSLPLPSGHSGCPSSCLACLLFWPERSELLMPCAHPSLPLPSPLSLCAGARLDRPAAHPARRGSGRRRRRGGSGGRRGRRGLGFRLRERESCLPLPCLLSDFLV